MRKRNAELQRLAEGIDLKAGNAYRSIIYEV